MWAYQPHFRIGLQIRADSVLQGLGVETKAVALLIGVADPSRSNRNPVCIEPEADRWSLELFAGLPEEVERTVTNHRLQNVFYGDEPSMAEKPRRIRQDSVTTAVQLALKSDDRLAGVRSYCGMAQLVGDHFVVPIIQVPLKDMAIFDSLEFPEPTEPFQLRKDSSFLDAALYQLLADAAEDLQRPDPGRLSRDRRSAAEVLRSAAATFMYTPGLVVDRQFMFGDLFQRVNQVSSLMYEGARGRGNLLLAKDDHPDVSGWPRHLDLNRTPREHCRHVEHGGRGLRGGGGVDRRLSRRRNRNAFAFQANGGSVDAASALDLVGFSRQAATCGAATPRCGCSTASAAA